MSKPESDQQLVERVQRGDKQAYNLLVIKYQNKVMHLVARYVYHSGDVADVTQEAFIKAYRSIASFRGESAFYTWLYRIAVNTAKNYLTAQDRRPPSSDLDADEIEHYDGADNLREISTPENELLSSEVERTVFAAIDSLPTELKMAITLREIEGMSYDDIANVMDCPVGTVRSRIFRAREVIDKRIQPLLNR